MGIADLAAIINYLGFWLPDGMSFTPMGQALISAGCVLFVLALNLLTVRLFGEVEFWFALIKILAILGLIAIGGFMVFSHFQAPTGTVASLSNLWSSGGMFPKGTEGFLAGFQIAVFAFVVVMAYFASKFLSGRFAQMSTSNGGRILEHLPLGPNRSVCVVELAGRILMLGVTEHSISLLGEIKDSDEIEQLLI